jgi:LPS-assembly protein
LSRAFSKKLILSIALITSDLALAREEENFQFKLGEKVHVLSDKAYRRTKDNMFEAVGNVIITHLNSALYGEKATLSFSSGETEVIGNVRYIAPGLTMYGSKLHYNFNTNYLNLKNARVLSDNYIIVGKEISRLSETVLTAEEAEYTTCRDCPESWSVFGKKIHVTVGEYVRIWHAYIKVKDVVVMYVPYLVLPIKKKRETGLLFPNFGFSVSEGGRFQQPFFWAISDHNDMTLTPSIFGKRGIGNELEYRQMLGEKTWFEFNSRHLKDHIYEPYKTGYEKSGTSVFRHFSEYEHHSSLGFFLNHHVYGNTASDLDTLRDYEEFTEHRVRGSELGVGGFLELRHPMVSVGAEAHYNNNTLYHLPKEFDDRYVQMLPKLRVASVPMNLVQTRWFGINSVNLTLDGDLTVFKQNHVDENAFIRNARRVNLAPRLDWHLGHMGPVALKTSALYDHQSYYLPTVKQGGKSFRKNAVVIESEASFEIDKVFGLAYEEEVVSDEVKSTKTISGPNVLGDIPTVDIGLDDKPITVKRNAYRHSQIFKLKHYHLADENFSGNRKFYNQIQRTDGQFDSRDAIRSRENEINTSQARTTLPLSNTIELQWNNSLIRKSPKKFDPMLDGRYLRDNFDYSTIAYFNISQGYDLDKKDLETKEALTRLALVSGVNFARSSLSLSDYYFYSTDSHLLSIRYDYNFDRLRLSGRFTYDAFSKPVDKYVELLGDIKLNDLFTFKGELEYDIATKKYNRTRYGVLYSPHNNCWMLDLGYEKNLIDDRYSINVYFNFNDNNFSSITGR